MTQIGKKPLTLVAYGLFGLALQGVAAAAPPAGRGAIAAVAGGSLRSASRQDFSRLDLRAPALPASGAKSLDAPSAYLPFPSVRRTATHTNDQDQLPSLGSDEAAPRVGRTEEWVRRVHREGLPLARLWQSHSALLSLGLNPRGKPGLWLIQKVQ